MAHGPRYDWAGRTAAEKIARLKTDVAREPHGSDGRHFYVAGILDILADVERRLPSEQPSYPRYDLIANYQMSR